MSKKKKRRKREKVSILTPPRSYRLLRAAEEALKPNSKMYLDIVDSIRDSHMLAGAALIRSPERLEELKVGIESECGHLTSFLSAAQIIDEISPKTKDSIIGAGEKLACLFMTALLQDRGIDAEYVNLENIIPSNYTAKKGLDQEFYDYLAKQLRERIQKCEGRVPVVTGERLPTHPPPKTPSDNRTP